MTSGNTERIRVVSGMAGAGKTTLLSAARMAWELEGFTVHGAALSGRAAKGLAEGAKIVSDTLHKTLFDIEKGKIKLTKKDILVVDEAGMVGTRQMEKLVSLTEQTRTRLILVGDAKQLQPIEAGGSFKAMEERLGAATLVGIKRQREEWARVAVKDFAFGNSRKALHAFAERGLINIEKDRRGAYSALVAAWKEQGLRHPEDQLIFTGERKEAAILNRLVQTERKDAGFLSEQFITTPQGTDRFYTGDRVLFTKKSRLLAVENGSLGEVVAIDNDKKRLHVRLDTGENVSLELMQYPHLSLGYAVTTHKGQGATVDRAFVLMGGTMQDREITYVQASRARAETRIFVDQETAGENITRLVQQVAMSRQKELAHAVAQTNRISQTPSPHYNEL
ncbi:MAG: hypothetical protein EOP06_23735 [Proteobacteria bacterium]|nr:MAG: hypothetical protein EOP06_23735 [Pseudomonadota bacterium]